MRRHGTRVVVVGLLSGLSACDMNDSPLHPNTRVESPISGHQRSAAARNIDSRFRELARSVPGFGGMFIDTATSRLTVYLKHPEDRASAMAAIRRAFPERTVADAEVAVRAGRFDWRELAAWRTKADAFLTIPGVIKTDIDERLNKISIGVENDAVRSRVTAELARLQVPGEAIMVRVVPRVRPFRTLRDPAANLEGGIQIFNPLSQAGAFDCTAGFNVQYNGYYGFMTASHCTTTEAEVNNTPFYQPDQNGRYLGSETVDPGYFWFGGENRGGWLCPRGARCRLSDAAIVQHATNSFGYGVIARTEFPGTGAAAGSITIDENAPTMIINGEASAVVGTSVGKMGRTSGWTAGSVTETCAHIVASTSDGWTWIQMCQDVVGARAEGGDSGAPVFATNLTGATLYGILWAGSYPAVAEFVYSPVGNIVDEFGTIRWR